MPHRTLAALARFDAVLPGKPFPKDWSELTATEQLQVNDYDPELAMLLQDRLPARVEMAVVSGQWAEAVPTPAERAEEARQDRIRELAAVNPWGVPGRYDENREYVPPVAPNLTRQLMVSELDPELAQKLQAEALPPPPDPGELFAAGQAAAAADAAVRLSSRVQSGIGRIVQGVQ